MTFRATPPEQHDPNVAAGQPRQPRTRREAREMAARAEAERAARAEQPAAVPAPTVPAPAAPAPTVPAPAAAAPAAQAPTGAAVWAAAPVTAQTPTIPAQAAPEQASVDPVPDHEAEHGEFAWLHAATHHHDDRGGRGGRGNPPKPPHSGGRGRRAVTWIVSVVVILGLIGGGALFAWNNFQPQVQAVMAHFNPQPTDYSGDGSGKVQVTIKQGDTGSAIARTLADAGVTRTPDAFYQLLLSTKPDPNLQPGVYQLRKHMSAASALTLLEDPKSKLAHTLLIREGDREATILQNASTATGIPLAQLKAAAASPAKFGLPPRAKSLEGFLFPATYTFDPGVTPDKVIADLVARAKDAFQDAGMPADQNKLWNTVVLASVVQAEAGPTASDLPLIAGVFTNRIAKGMALQSDATVHYGLGTFDTVFTTDSERADASNAYNSYVHKGLPPGPIGNPGEAALKAALAPQGDYLYFTTVNLQTGKTAFAKTLDQQNANVAQLQDWCQDPANKAYCK